MRRKKEKEMNEMEKNLKEDVRNKIDRVRGVIPVNQEIVSVPMGDFPLRLWIEWEEDCKKNFNNRRWLKAWSDHLEAQLYRLQRQVAVQKTIQEVTEQKEDIKPILLSGLSEKDMLEGGKNVK